MVKIHIALVFCCVLAFSAGQRITTIHLDGVQYFISRMNPYSPELNYFLAYQYCRSLGLQLASFETKEKAESMTTYLKNAGYGNYDFWTSGNRLGTGMFLWMSTGLPFNATFDFFENSNDAIQVGVLDPADHNSNTSPQRTARDRRRITSPSTTPTATGFLFSTTPMPAVLSSYNPYINKDHDDVRSHSPLAFIDETNEEEHLDVPGTPHEPNINNDNRDNITQRSIESKETHEEINDGKSYSDHSLKFDVHINQTDKKTMTRFNGHLKDIDNKDEKKISKNLYIVKVDDTVTIPHTVNVLHGFTNNSTSTTPSSGKNLGQFFQNLEFQSNTESINQKSFLSLSDLIQTLAPHDKNIMPHIDSDYSNASAMRVIGEATSMGNDPREF